MFVTGAVIFLAFWLLWIKLSLQTRLRMLAYPFSLDIGISVIVWLMYGGTGEGMLAATMAALVMSVNISLARKLFGYIEETEEESLSYVPGVFNQSKKLSLNTE